MVTTSADIKFFQWRKHPELFKKKEGCDCIQTIIYTFGTPDVIQDIDGLCDKHLNELRKEQEKSERIRAALIEEYGGSRRAQRERRRRRFKKKEELSDDT